MFSGTLTSLETLNVEINANFFRKDGVFSLEDDITESNVSDKAETEKKWKRL